MKNNEMMKKMENGETVIGMLHHVIIGLWYRSHECTPSWTSDDKGEYTEVTSDEVERPLTSTPLQGSDIPTLNGKEWSGSQPYECDKQHQGASGKNPPLVPAHEHYPKIPGVVFNTKTLPLDQVTKLLVDHLTVQDFLHHPLFFAIHNFR